ncbi:MFS transporter, FHS family, L-fucose permease [Novosphingobium sp. CF614]|uniref:glucose/galactose MFS transporter n=1 Tax=Novosphingobium sp. CF614 TaxID=1884364 RepID=UPI0008F054D4|nr:glucose/galactose MFS transporter [Novosphingobium sp. CF614]SFG50725.1 MFS transporter, FHS family, L-fucose permease [Novosphingobium sp. CF614]
MTQTRRATSAFASVTALFFAWGFITSLVDPLVAAVKSIFSLSNVEAQLSAFAFFIAYGLVSIPAAVFVARLRAIRSVVTALVMMVAACLIILAASNSSAYEGVLIGLFVLASGITILQVAANPLAAALGPPERSHLRLTLSQAFNSLGTVLGPLLGAGLLLRGLEAKPGALLDSAARENALRSIDTAFLLIAGLIVALILFIWAMRKRIEAAAPASSPVAGFTSTLGKALGSRWAMLGGLAIFLYVGAEVSIGTQMALFLHDPAVWDVSLQNAGYYVSLYWLGAMVGRFAGSALLMRIPAYRLLAFATCAAAILCLVVFIVGGVGGGYAAILVGLFNSIMFPTIFTLTLERSTAGDEATSGFLCTAIVGGAFLPLLAGAISDAHGYVASFIVPMLCYTLLCGFAVAAGRASIVRDESEASVATVH